MFGRATIRLGIGPHSSSPCFRLCGFVRRKYIFSERELTSPIRLSVVCRLSVMLLHPTQAVEMFGNISTAFGTLAIRRHLQQFYGDRPRGTPPSEELNITGVAKHSDFGPIEGYISETVQDRR